MESKLENLLLKKRFSDLSHQEKEYALSKISKTEYSNFRTLLIASNQVFNKEFEQINLDRNIKKKLTQAFKTKHTKPSFSFKNLLRQNYYLKPAIAFSVIILLFFTVINSINHNKESNINSVTNYLLNENNFIKNNSTDDLYNSNTIADSLDTFSEMNEYLKIRTQGLTIQ